MNGLFIRNVRYLVFPFLYILNGCGDSEGRDQSPQTEIEGVTLSGRVNYPQNGYITLDRFTVDGIVAFDTISLKQDNTFAHFVEIPSPGYYRLNFYGKQTVNIILNNDDLEIVADGNAPSGFFDISGSTELGQLRSLNEFLQREFVSQENKLNQEYVNAKKSKDEKLALEVQEAYMQLAERKEEAVKREITLMGSSLAIMQAINYVDKDKNFQFVDSVTQVLVRDYPDVPNVHQLAAQVEQMRLVAIGEPAPEIALPSPEGNIIKLSSLKGQYVLLDFWAEWCKPCRAENPNVVNAYKKYHDKGFEVFGVSLDKTKEKWQKAIRQDGLTWTHVSDLKGWQSVGAKTYNVSAIPASFLLDHEGIIIGKNLRGPALQQKLEELLGGNP